MNARSKLAAFGLVLATALGAGALAGNVVGPISAGEDRMDDMDGGTHETAGATPVSEAEGEVDIPAGVLISQDGYTLDPEATILPAGTESDAEAGTEPELRFRILDPGGRPVHDYVVGHERELHLIVVGTDLATYHHLHPTRDAGGTWSTTLPGLAPGSYRAFADFTVADGPELTLGVDLSIAGETVIAPLPEPDDTATVDGYEVTLTGTATAGAASELGLSVRRDGRPVTDLDPYLGAFGHLVAIRSGDLAYLHVHPLGDEPSAGDRGGPEVAFAVEVPSPGDYRMFFDFSHDGTVRTAAFTVHVAADDATATADAPEHAESGGHG